MKVIGFLTTLINTAKRLGLGMTDVKHLFDAVKKNKEDATVTPEGQIEYQRLAGFLTACSIILMVGLHAFGVVEVEAFETIITELFKLLKTLN